MIHKCTIEAKHIPPSGGLAKEAVQCYADTLVVNLSMVLHINISGKDITFAERETAIGNAIGRQYNIAPDGRTPNMQQHFWPTNAALST